MQALDPSQKIIFAEAVLCDSGANLDYLSFIEIALATFEDVPGFETTLPKLDLLDELWRIYSAIAD